MAAAVEPGALKIEPRGADRPKLQHADCGCLTNNGGPPRGRAGCPPAAQLQDHQSPEARGHSSEGVVRDVVALFLGRGELPPVQQTGLHTDQRATDSSNRRTRTWPIFFLFRSGDGHR